LEEFSALKDLASRQQQTLDQTCVRAAKWQQTTLFIGERTVDCHVSNTFNKLDVASRAAATANALRPKLV